MGAESGARGLDGGGWRRVRAKPCRWLEKLDKTRNRLSPGACRRKQLGQHLDFSPGRPTWPSDLWKHRG